MYYDYRILHVKLPISGLAASEIGRCISAPWKSPITRAWSGFNELATRCDLTTFLSYYGHLFGIVVSRTSVLLNRALIKQHVMLVLLRAIGSVK